MHAVQLTSFISYSEIKRKKRQIFHEYRKYYRDFLCVLKNKNGLLRVKRFHDANEMKHNATEQLRGISENGFPEVF